MKSKLKRKTTLKSGAREKRKDIASVKRLKEQMEYRDLIENGIPDPFGDTPTKEYIRQLKSLKRVNWSIFAKILSKPKIFSTRPKLIAIYLFCSYYFHNANSPLDIINLNQTMNDLSTTLSETYSFNHANFNAVKRLYNKSEFFEKMLIFEFLIVIMLSVDGRTKGKLVNSIKDFLMEEQKRQPQSYMLSLLCLKLYREFKHKKPSLVSFFKSFKFVEDVGNFKISYKNFMLQKRLKLAMTRKLHNVTLRSVCKNSLVIEFFEEIFSLDESVESSALLLYYLCMVNMKDIAFRNVYNFNTTLDWDTKRYLTLSARIYGISNWELLEADRDLVMMNSKNIKSKKIWMSRKNTIAYYKRLIILSKANPDFITILDMFDYIEPKIGQIKRISEGRKFQELMYNCAKESDSISILPFISYCLFFDTEKYFENELREMTQRALDELDSKSVGHCHILSLILRQDLDYKYADNNDYEVFAAFFKPEIEREHDRNEQHHGLFNNNPYRLPIQCHLEKIIPSAEGDFYYLRADYSAKSKHFLKIVPSLENGNICKVQKLDRTLQKRYKIYYPKKLLFSELHQERDPSPYDSSNKSNTHPYPYIWNHRRILPFNNNDTTKDYLYQSLSEDKYKNLEKNYNYFFRISPLLNQGIFLGMGFMNNHDHFNHMARFNNPQINQKSLLKITTRTRKILLRYNLPDLVNKKQVPGEDVFIGKGYYPSHFIKTTINGVETELVIVECNDTNYCAFDPSGRVFRTTYKVLEVASRGSRLKDLNVPQEFQKVLNRVSLQLFRYRHTNSGEVSRVRFCSPYVILQELNHLSFYSVEKDPLGPYFLQMRLKVVIPGILGTIGFSLELHCLSKDRFVLTLNETKKRSDRYSYSIYEEQYNLLCYIVDFEKKIFRFLKSFQGPEHCVQFKYYSQKMISIVDSDDCDKLEMIYCANNRGDLRGDYTIQVASFREF